MKEITLPKGWKKEKLADLLFHCRNGTSARQVNYKTNYPVTRIETISKSKINLNKVGYVNYFDKIRNYELEQGDILLSHINSVKHIGKVAIFNSDNTLYHGMNLLLLKFDFHKCNPIFMFYLLSCSTSKNFFERNCKKAINQASLNQKDIGSMPVVLPSILEQQKIVEILATVDETIEETDNIIQACEKIKGGLMQKLLMKGLPGWHKKFKKTKIGDIPKNWKYCKFKDAVLKFKNGGTPSTKIKSYWEGDIPWVTGADFLDGKIVEFRKFINEDAVKNSATNVIPKGNLLIVTRTGVGKLAIAHTDIAISQDITGIMLSEDVDPHYAYWYFMKNIKILKSLNQGTSINGIIRSDLENFIFIYPDKNEQQEIVSILSIFVDRIESEKQKKSQLEILKKGLMQKLLTGEVRVKVN